MVRENFLPKAPGDTVQYVSLKAASLGLYMYVGGDGCSSLTRQWQNTQACFLIGADLEGYSL
jgi:hypothetical protein